MKHECAWCGEVKEVYGWHETGTDYDGAETYDAICEDCYRAIFDDDPSSEGDTP